MFLIVLASSAINAQTWIKQLPMDGLPHWAHNDTKMCNVIVAIDGGYIAQGYKTNSTEDGWAWHDFNILWKLDEDGNVLQRTMIDIDQVIVSMVSNGVDRYYCLAQGDMGGLTLLIVLDTDLNLLETYYFETVNGYSITLYDMQYADDGLVFAGCGYHSSVIVLKTSFQFNVIWQSEPYHSRHVKPRSVEPYGNEWVATTGREFFQYSAIGDTLWTYIDNTNRFGILDAVVAVDSSVYLLGVDRNGFRIKRVNFDEQSFDDVAILNRFNLLSSQNSIAELANGNLIYLGKENSGEVLHCYNPDGVHQWSRAYDTHRADSFGDGSKNLLAMPDGSIIFCMWHPDVCILIKTDVQGNVVANDDPIIPAPVASITAYPQPANNRLTLSIKSDLPGNLSYSIYNIKGQMLHTAAVSGHQREQSIDLDAKIVGSLPNGIYLVNLKQNNKTIASCKVVIVK